MLEIAFSTVVIGALILFYVFKLIHFVNKRKCPKCGKLNSPYDTNESDYISKDFMCSCGYEWSETSENPTKYANYYG